MTAWELDVSSLLQLHQFCTSVLHIPPLQLKSISSDFFFFSVTPLHRLTQTYCSSKVACYKYMLSPTSQLSPAPWAYETVCICSLNPQGEPTVRDQAWPDYAQIRHCHWNSNPVLSSTSQLVAICLCLFIWARFGRTGLAVNTKLTRWPLLAYLCLYKAVDDTGVLIYIAV